MFLGYPNFSAWLTAKLLATYGRKRFNINNPTQRQAYIAAHQDPDTFEWQQPIDLKRVSFTNLSQYNTEYSVFKYVLETELDVLHQAPYNQLNVYTEIINHTAPNTFTKPIGNTGDNTSFLVGIHSGLIQQISTLFLTTNAVTKILESLSNLSKINDRFLKSFAMELAVKATIYTEFANIFTQHPTLQNHLPNDVKTLPEKYKNDVLVGEFLMQEIQNRTHTLVESDFFADLEEANILADEVRQFCIATLYIHYAQQSQSTDNLSAAEHVFCAFYTITKNDENNTQLLLETMNKTHSIIDAEGIKTPLANLYELHNRFSKDTQA